MSYDPNSIIDHLGDDQELLNKIAEHHDTAAVHRLIRQMVLGVSRAQGRIAVPPIGDGGQDSMLQWTKALFAQHGMKLDVEVSFDAGLYPKSAFGRTYQVFARSTTDKDAWSNWGEDVDGNLPAFLSWLAEHRPFGWYGMWFYSRAQSALLALEHDDDGSYQGRRCPCFYRVGERCVLTSALNMPTSDEFGIELGFRPIDP